MPTRALTTMSAKMLLRPARPSPDAHDRPDAPRHRCARAARRTSLPPPSSGDGRHRNGRAGVERHPQYPARRDHHAGEPLVRQLLRHIPRRGRHPDAERCAHRLRARGAAAGAAKLRLDRPHVPSAQRERLMKYYVAEGTQPDCDDDEMTCEEKPQSAVTPQVWNPLPWFETVRENGQVGNI